MNKKIPFSIEEFLPKYKGGSDIEIFKKLYSFYITQKIKEVSSKKYIKSLISKMKEKKIKDDYLKNILKKSLNFDKKLLITKEHGNLVQEYALSKDNSWVFID